MSGLSPMLSRVLAIALLLSVMLAGKYLVADPVIQSGRALADRVERAERLLVAFRARRKELIDHATGTGGDSIAERNQLVFLAGTNPTLVGAKLQGHVQALIEASGGRLISSQILQTKPKDGLRWVTLRARMTASIEAVQSVLHALETEKPYLFVDNVSFRANRANRRPNKRRPAARKSIPAGHMNISFDIIGYLPAGDGS